MLHYHQVWLKELFWTVHYLTNFNYRKTPEWFTIAQCFKRVSKSVSQENFIRISELLLMMEVIIFLPYFLPNFFQKNIQENENNLWLFWILGVATVHQLVIAAASPLVRKAISNMDPAARMEDKLTCKFVFLISISTKWQIL